MAENKKSTRLQIPNPGHYYSDLLNVDASLNNRSAPMQAQSLLCAKLQEREKLIKERVQYLADRDRRPFNEVWEALRNGNYEPSNGSTFTED
jgi:hypothetical protein